VTHPSVEEVALHLEGVLDPADEQRLRAHLEHCARCAVTARDLRGVTEQLHVAARSPESAPAMPADVAARVESALARESDDRADEAVPASATHSAGGGATGATVGDLVARRRRRRRVLSGGLLAAAAATVVAVGLGQLMQSGGESAQFARGGSAGSVTAERQPARQPDTLRSGPQASALGGESLGRGRDGALGKQGTLAAATRLRDAGLIEGVAAAHSPARARHDLLGCVRGALGADLGPMASYAVRLPKTGGVPGVVVLRPSRRPTEGVLVACTAPPQVLARRGLQP